MRLRVGLEMSSECISKHRLQAAILATLTGVYMRQQGLPDAEKRLPTIRTLSQTNRTLARALAGTFTCLGIVF